jgi:hypothetical protein
VLPLSDILNRQNWPSLKALREPGTRKRGDMKQSLVVAAIAILVTMAANWSVGAGSPFFKPGSEPDGFRDIKWGTHIDTLTGMTKFGSDPSLGGIEKYSRNSDVLRMDGANLSRILYGFWRQQLLSVTIEAEGASNCTALLKASVDKFGPGYKTKKAERYRWNGSLTEILYDKTGNDCLLLMQSNKVREEAEHHLRAKAKEGAEKSL